MPTETRILLDIALVFFIFAIIMYTIYGPSTNGRR